MADTKEKKDEDQKSKDAEETKDDAETRDDGEKRDDDEKKTKKTKKKKDEDTDQEESEDTRPAGPSLGSKIFRAFLFTFAATFLTAFLFADPIPNGLRVEFDLLASIKLALIAGVIAAVLRAVVGMLPVFADD